VDLRIATQMIKDREDVIRWLALVYRIVSYDEDGNEHVDWNLPVIATEGFKGRPLPDGARLAATFREVVEDSDAQ
jgi:hypothetical protein